MSIVASAEQTGRSLSFLPPSIPIKDVRDLSSDLYDERYPGVLDVLAGQFSHAHKGVWILRGVLKVGD